MGIEPTRGGLTRIACTSRHEERPLAPGCAAGVQSSHDRIRHGGDLHRCARSSTTARRGVRGPARRGLRRRGHRPCRTVPLQRRRVAALGGPLRRPRRRRRRTGRRHRRGRHRILALPQPARPGVASPAQAVEVLGRRGHGLRRARDHRLHPHPRRSSWRCSGASRASSSTRGTVDRRGRTWHPGSRGTGSTSRCRRSPPRSSR